MKKAALLLVGLGSVLMSNVALAEGYFGVNYAQINQDDRFFGGNSFSTGDVMARLNGRINNHFSVEWRVGTTAVSEEKNKIEYRETEYHAVYLRADTAFGPIVPYAMIGHLWGKEQIVNHNNGSAAHGKYDDTSMGAGIDINMGKSFGVELEYIMLSNQNNVMRKGPSAGVYYHF